MALRILLAEAFSRGVLSQAVPSRGTTMNLEELITVTPGVRSGKPCIAGSRIAVYDILEYLAGGMTEQEILNDFPSLRLEHIRATLVFAANREKRLAATGPKLLLQ
jgi:uncharacterized protein (DUF433 family)